MNVEIITETKQRFKGENYYLCGQYFQRRGKRLHREVWKHYNGDIPKGYHIHHKDGDRSNNQIDNLEMLSASEHESHHHNGREDADRMYLEKYARPKASQWHKSEEGLRWHSKQGKENWEKRKFNTYICTECGKEFSTKTVYKGDRNRFCHQNCRARYGRRKRLEGKICTI